MLDIQDLTFDYVLEERTRRIFYKTSLSLKKGEIVSLVGASGSGKTTLFRLITGLLKGQEGEILIEGGVNPLLATYLPQEDLLLPWRSVIDNLLLIYELEKKPLDRGKAREMLERVGLSGCEELYPQELSGGMRQRVALARALLQNRPLLLLDEPFGSLDVIIREELYHLLREICLSKGITLLFITHDFRDALHLSDRLLVLSQQKISHSFPLKDLSLQERENVMHSIRNTLSSS